MSRTNLQAMLEQLLGSRNVYYQPPESLKLSYPAIVYSKDNVRNTFADNNVYGQSNVYKITVIDRDPESEIASKISLLPTAKFATRYSANDLTHEVYTIYYN